jgi:hypothetical protein
LDYRFELAFVIGKGAAQRVIGIKPNGAVRFVQGPDQGVVDPRVRGRMRLPPFFVVLAVHGLGLGFRRETAGK